MPGSFFEQDHLLNLSILGVYAKKWLNVNVFQNRNWCSTKSDRRFFFLTLPGRRPFHSKDFKEKNVGVRGYFLKKRKLTCRTSQNWGNSQQSLFCRSRFFTIIFIRCLWLRIIWRSIKVFSLWIFLNRYFLTMLIMVTEQL